MEAKGKGPQPTLQPEKEQLFMAVVAAKRQKQRKTGYRCPSHREGHFGSFSVLKRKVVGGEREEQWFVSF